MASSWIQHDIDLPFFEKRNSSGSTNNVCSRHLNFHRIIFFFSYLKSKEGRYLLFRTKNVFEISQKKIPIYLYRLHTLRWNMKI